MEDILKLYGQDDDITSTTVQVTFLNEPAEDADGLTRELFPQGWKSILPYSLRESISMYPVWIPTAPKNCLRTLAALLAMVLCSLPIFLLDLIYSFLSFLTGGEWAAAERAMQKHKVSLDDILIDVLSRYNVREIPSNTSEYHSLFVRITKCEFVTKPNLLMAAFKRGLLKAHPAVWEKLDAVAIRALYASLFPTPEKVVIT